ncbi:TPA: threonylcarbamoyl-AMP synthase [Candidatus Micrarchaeota archaeon]|nr:threonylcarbamoyl-AMP synthase [Candidatus Micrarchaeota archaeon]
MKQTKIVKLEHDREKMAKILDQSASVIKKGGIIAFPTETSYGLGCDATNATAIKKIYEIKGRDEANPLPIIVSDIHMAEEYCILSDKAVKLVNAFMPGPLSIIVKKRDKLPEELSPAEKGVAFRIPAKEFARIMVQEAGVPVVSTSANFSGKSPIYKIEELKQTFNNKIDMIIDGGDLPPIRPSTIIDLCQEPPVVVREGPLNSKDVLHELNDE